MTERPPITPSLTLADFTSWYWLKTDLVLLCHTFGVSPTGNKLDLEDRIRAHLSGIACKSVSKRRTTGEMPSTFTPATVIGAGWRCNPALGAYFRKAIGSRFQFNAAMREFIHNGAGRTLDEAAICFHASTLPTAPKTLIPRQLQYNQHFRDFFAAHPNATRQQAIDSWWEKRSKRNGARPRTD